MCCNKGMRTGLLSLALLAVSATLPAYAQVGQDLKAAGQDTGHDVKKGATKSTHAVKKGATKSTHAVKSGVHKTATKVSDKTNTSPQQ